MSTDPSAIIPAPLRAYLPLLQGILVASGILIVGWVASGWFHRLALRALTLRHIDQALGRFLASILRYLALAATVIAAMEAVGIHTTSLVAIMASAGLAVGLALQGSLSNFASGVLILFFRPFQLGDKVNISDKIGIVEDIGLFTTTLVSSNNEKFILPNTTVTGGAIINYSERGTLRGTLTVGVVVQVADVERVMALLCEAARGARGIAKDPPPEVLIGDMEEGAVDLVVAVWYRSVEEPQVMHALRFEVMKALKAAGVVIKVRDKMLLAKA